MIVQLTDEQKVTLHATPLTEGGNIAPVDGTPTWEASDPSLVSLVPALDGFSCEVITAGPLGSCIVTCTADADLGAGIVTILGTADIVVVQALAASLEVTADAPVIK